MLAALVPAALLAAAAEAGAAQASDAVAAKALERSSAEVRDYWTPERMRGAKPVERLADRVGEAVRSVGAIGAAAPSRQAAEAASASTYPGRTHGKVFFTIPGGGNFVCSGTVVRSGGRDVVLTAGHCVYDDARRRFATNWMFVPGFQDGQRPFGEWVARKLATTSQFRSTGNLRFDVGVAVVRRDRNGRGVQDRVGARRVAFNQPRNQRYRAFGYPARGRFNGQRLYRCDSPYRGEDQSFAPPRPMRIDCDMTAGSSGGGWVAGNGSVASVTSYAYECTPTLPVLPCNNPEAGKLFGPYFGNEVRALYRANRGRARRCGGEVVTHRGSRRADRLTGTRGPDVMHGGAGRDLLRGRAGNDVICAGRGHDRVVTGSGRNRVTALKGRNRIRCGPGRDVVITNRVSRVSGPCDVVIRR